MMSVGDVYELTIPPALAFGAKGRRASAGKPSIPAGAYVNVSSAALCLCRERRCWMRCSLLVCASVHVQPAARYAPSVLTCLVVILVPPLPFWRPFSACRVVFRPAVYGGDD